MNEQQMHATEHDINQDCEQQLEKEMMLRRGSEN